MKRFASVTFDGVLAASKRDAILQPIRSAAALVTSWNDGVGGTSAFSELLVNGEFVRIPLRSPFEPPFVALRITPRQADLATELVRIFAGPGRPRGVVEAFLEPGAVVVTFAPRITSLGFIVALIDATLERSLGRTIEALLPLDDATLCAFAGEMLGEPDLDASRLIETYLEPMLARESS